MFIYKKKIFFGLVKIDSYLFIYISNKTNNMPKKMLTEQQFNCKFWLLEQMKLLEEQKLNDYQADKLINLIEENKTNPVILEIFNILQNLKK